MSRFRLLALAAAGLFVSFMSRAQYADSVILYEAGTGFAINYTNPASALGEPSRVTPGAYGGPVDPFAPAFLPSQLVSIGSGGSLTLQFNTPILNDPGHPFDIDFIVFGNAGFIITNGDYSGGGITDGSLFGSDPGVGRVSVSADGANFYTLDPALAPEIDGLFPTDGSGHFQIPVNPSLVSSDFAGADLAAIRSLYDGSGGGAGFSLSWALDDSNQSVFLPSASYVRLEVISGAPEIDGIAVVPEPAASILLLAGAGLLLGCQRHNA